MPKRRGRPAIIWRITTAGRGWLDDQDTGTEPSPQPPQHRHNAKTEQAQRTATERNHALNQARATFSRETPRISRKRAAQQLRDLGCTLDEIGAVFRVGKERIRQDLLWDPAARTSPRMPKPRNAPPPPGDRRPSPSP